MVEQKTGKRKGKRRKKRQSFLRRKKRGRESRMRRRRGGEGEEVLVLFGEGDGKFEEERLHEDYHNLATRHKIPPPVFKVHHPFHATNT